MEPKDSHRIMSEVEHILQQVEGIDKREIQLVKAAEKLYQQIYNFHYHGDQYRETRANIDKSIRLFMELRERLHLSIKLAKKIEEDYMIIRVASKNDSRENLLTNEEKRIIEFSLIVDKKIEELIEIYRNLDKTLNDRVVGNNMEPFNRLSQLLKYFEDLFKLEKQLEHDSKAYNARK